MFYPKTRTLTLKINNKHLKDLTDEEIQQVITKVANNHAGKSFGSYQSEDIVQQSLMICWQKLPEYQSKRAKEKHNTKQSLENWLNKVVSNRLKNFYRDNHQNKRKKFKTDKSDYDLKKRESLLEPASINEIYSFEAKDISYGGFSTELLTLILPKISYEEYDILESVLNGEKINSYYKKQLQRKVRSILSEHGI